MYRKNHSHSIDHACLLMEEVIVFGALHNIFVLKMQSWKKYIEYANIFKNNLKIFFEEEDGRLKFKVYSCGFSGIYPQYLNTLIP